MSYMEDCSSGRSGIKKKTAAMEQVVSSLQRCLPTETILFDLEVTARVQKENMKDMVSVKKKPENKKLQGVRKQTDKARKPRAKLANINLIISIKQT